MMAMVIHGVGKNGSHFERRGFRFPILRGFLFCKKYGHVRFRQVKPLKLYILQEAGYSQFLFLCFNKREALIPALLKFTVPEEHPVYRQQ
jgi:hypothetical protein